MASTRPPLHSSSFLPQLNPNLLLHRRPNFLPHHSGIHRRYRAAFIAVADVPEKPTKLVTFLGKGGSGKTTSSVIAAQHYAKIGLRTCLVIHSQDPTAEYLMGCKIGTSPTICNTNLSAVRLETTKMLLGPLSELKKADARLNLTQGVLEGVVGEELGVLPGMDSIFSVIEIEKLVQFLGVTVGGRNYSQEKYDIVVYDGMNAEETLRIIGAPNRARWYLKYIRNIAQKTDIGRLTAPSLVKLADEAVRLNGRSFVNGRTSAETWDDVECILEKASAAFSEPSKFRCYLVMDPDSQISVASAMRYWGCAIQAGGQISGAFGVAPEPCLVTTQVAESMSPLSFALLPYLSIGSCVDWDLTLKYLSEDVRNLLSTGSSKIQSSVKFDPSRKSVTLFMPGFDKSEIKLYQYRGGSELLVEAGDQRRIIPLPRRFQGKVGGAKFVDRSLVVTLR